MDRDRFDELAKIFAGSDGTDRRTLLKRLAAAGVAGAAALRGVQMTAAAPLGRVRTAEECDACNAVTSGHPNAPFHCVCHKERGRPDIVLCVNDRAYDAHIDHGDAPLTGETFGTCKAKPPKTCPSGYSCFKKKCPYGYICGKDYCCYKPKK